MLSLSGFILFFVVFALFFRLFYLGVVHAYVAVRFYVGISLFLLVFVVVRFPGSLLRFSSFFSVNAVVVRSFVVIVMFFFSSTYVRMFFFVFFSQVMNCFMRQLKSVVDDSSSTKMLQLWQHQVKVFPLYECSVQIPKYNTLLRVQCTET